MMCYHVKQFDKLDFLDVFKVQTEMIITEPISQGRCEAETINELMRIEIYFPIIDVALTELIR